MKKLSVKSTSIKEVEEKWGIQLPFNHYSRELFVRCNAKGEVKWESTLLYFREELRKRGDYQIIIVIDVDEVIKNESFE